MKGGRVGITTMKHERGKYKYIGPTGKVCYSDLTQEQIDELAKVYPDKTRNELSRMFDVHPAHIEYLRQAMDWHKSKTQAWKREGKPHGSEVYMEKNGNKRYAYCIHDAAELLCTDPSTIRRACETGTLVNGWKLEYGDIL